MGYGKQSHVDLKAQTQNVNVNVSDSADENDKIRREILSKLAPKEKIF